MMKHLSVAFLLLAAFVLACGGSTEPIPEDGGTADAATAELPAIPCGPLMCAGTTPNCLKASGCGFSASDCKDLKSGAGTCPAGYDDCQPLVGVPGCISLYSYQCIETSACKQTGPRTYGECDC